MGIWVDMDAGFDDLWALLVLKQAGVIVDGVSLVAGNVGLDQVLVNATAAWKVFDFTWPLAKGAGRPLQRTPITAETILGARGMRSRGQYLPVVPPDPDMPDAQSAFFDWLVPGPGQRHVLALGPLTNLALLARAHPDRFALIDRITWMGGSNGAGNHTKDAEFNAVADPEAAAEVIASSVPLFVVDLEICRQVTFTSADMPQITGPNGDLLADLLGGYLDIGLSRGRKKMSIYDPVAALALAKPEMIRFTPMRIEIETGSGTSFGKTCFERSEPANGALATQISAQAAAACLSVFRKDA